MENNTFLLNKIPTNILLALKEKSNLGKNQLKMSHVLNCTYSYYLKIIQKLEERDFIIIQKFGRDKQVFLSKKGEELRGGIYKVLSLVGEEV